MTVCGLQVSLRPVGQLAEVGKCPNTASTELKDPSEQPAYFELKAIDDRDYWTGLADPAARRKAQNRLNQRARRRRNAPDKWTPLRSRIEDVARKHQTAPELAVTSAAADCSPCAEPFPWPILKLEARELLRDYFPLSTDHLIHLVQFNVFRAMLTNMLTLRITHLFNCEEDLTPWIGISALPLPAAIPPSLEPTALQRQVPHAPYVDLFPLPGLRNTLVRAEGGYDDCDLCLDMLGFISTPHFESGPVQADNDDGNDRKGLVVWGEPWRVDSWEVEEGFVRKWGWTLREGCEELLRSTDKWRELRGEEPLRWSKWGLDA